jgi:FixJ family two-component response regulator
MINQESSRIFIIDDDKSVLRGLSILLQSIGYESDTFTSVAEFLKREQYFHPSCILLDINLGGESGLDLLDAIRGRFSWSPVIYITGFGDIPKSVSALKKGAINFLQKPVDETLLFDAIREALKLSKSLIDNNKEIAVYKARIESLTPREFRIFTMVIKGLMNKQIACELNIAEHTVKLHRGKVTEKLGVKAVAELIYIAERLHLNN